MAQQIFGLVCGEWRCCQEVLKSVWFGSRVYDLLDEFRSALEEFREGVRVKD